MPGVQVDPGRPWGWGHQTQAKAGVRMCHLSERRLNEYLQTDLQFLCGALCLHEAQSAQSNYTLFQASSPHSLPSSWEISFLET